MINPSKRVFKPLKKIKINDLISDLQHIINNKSPNETIIARYVDIEGVRFYTDFYIDQDDFVDEFYTGLTAWVLIAHLIKQKEIFDL